MDSTIRKGSMNSDIDKDLNVEIRLEQDVLSPLQTEQQQQQQQPQQQEQYDVPETKGLLPPLPDEQQLISSKQGISPGGGFGLNTGDFEQPVYLNDTLISPKSLQRNRSIKSTFATPIQDSISRFESVPEISTPNPTSIYSFESQKHSLDGSLLHYSPTMNIKGRFEVSIDIEIDSETKSPKTLEERIKLYKEIQKKEYLEFNKTLQELTSSGWMTESQLKELEISKTKNFQDWENKIQSLKDALILPLDTSLSSLSLNPSPLTSQQRQLNQQQIYQQQIYQQQLHQQQQKSHKSNFSRKNSGTSLLGSPIFSKNSPISNNDEIIEKEDDVVKSTHEKLKRKLSSMVIR